MEHSIEDIAAMLHGLEAVRNNNVIVYNSQWLAAKCALGHIHKYLLNDIIASNNIRCITCSANNKFGNTVREIVEEAFKIPFMLISNTPLELTYTNHLLQITIICKKTATDIQYIDDGLVFVINRTTSKNKIKNILLESLRNTSAEKIPKIDTIIANLSGTPKYYRKQAPPPLGKKNPGNNYINSKLYFENC